MKAILEAKGTMKAVRIHSFGGPDVLRYEDAPTPQPKENQVLVRVHSAGVNPVDWKIREGHLGPCEFPCTMGEDFSGVIDSVGPGVEGFKAGDEVFGRVADESGSYAEFALAATGGITRKPTEIDYAHAAAMPVAALTAWQALFDTGHLEADQTVLIHAAAGGVGEFAVQFAKWKRAYVIGTASAKSTDFVHSLGADEVIDYNTQRFENVVREADLVLDAIGGATQERSFGVLRRGGTLVSIVQPPSEERAHAAGVRAVFMVSQPRGNELARIADLVVAGKVKVFVEKTFSLSDARQAQIESQSGHAHGKIVLSVA